MNDDAQSSMSPDGSVGTGQPTRKKQKRNKPTLSCLECVERKTKVSARVFANKKEMVDAEAVAMLNDVKHDNLSSRCGGAESARSAIAAGLTVWRASSDNRHAGTRTWRTSSQRLATSKCAWLPSPSSKQC
jgi:hypothetical protein